jgi:hypothetical protein
MLPLGAFEHCGDRKIKLHGGGGGGLGGFVEDIGGGISDAFSSVGDFVGDAFSGAGDILASVDPGPAIGDVGQVIDEGVNDVVPGGWATVGAATVAALTMQPELLAAMLPEEAAMLTTEEILASQFGDAAFQLSPEFASLAPEAASAMDLTGEALMNGDISGLTSNATDMMLNGNPSLQAIDIANASADPIATLNAANNWTGPMTQNIGTIATEMAAQGVPTDVIANQLMQNYGIDQYAALNAASVAMEGGTAEDIASMLEADYGENFQGPENYDTPATDPTKPFGLSDALNAARLLGLGKSLLGGAGSAGRAVSGLLGGSSAPKPLLKTPTSLSDVLGGGSSGAGGAGALPGNLQATMLTSSAGSNPNMNLNQLKQLYPQLSTVDPRILSTLTGKGASQSPSYYNYGSDPTTSLMSAPRGGAPAPGYPSQASSAAPSSASKFMGTTALPAGSNALASAGLRAVTDGALPGMKSGGNVHRPEFITGATGHFVQGRGDGQSDDIPAMLADGEYVFDADTVAALGNGSSKAGAVQLDKMREAIRKHKRSAAHNKIPPKAKSPLDYLKG